MIASSIIELTNVRTVIHFQGVLKWPFVQKNFVCARILYFAFYKQNHELKKMCIVCKKPSLAQLLRKRMFFWAQFFLHVCWCVYFSFEFCISAVAFRESRLNFSMVFLQCILLNAEKINDECYKNEIIKKFSFFYPLFF